MLENLIYNWSKIDFYIQKPIIDECLKSKFLKPQIIITGSHLYKQFGKSQNEILRNYKKKYSCKKIKNLIIKDEHKQSFRFISSIKKSNKNNYENKA